MVRDKLWGTAGINAVSFAWAVLNDGSVERLGQKILLLLRSMIPVHGIRRGWRLERRRGDNQPVNYAIGTKPTFLFVPRMSAFGGKADMAFCTANVRL